jgi:hypothetical protein
MKSLAKISLLGLSMLCGGQALALVIDFEGLNGMTYLGGSSIPSASRLSTQLLQTQGVKFSSTDPYVAIVQLGTGHATSGVNGIGGAKNGILSYSSSDPINISFFIPSDPTQKAITTMVSLRPDRWGGGGQVSLVAYNDQDAVLATVSAVDSSGPLLSITHPGIHKVSFIGTTYAGGVAVDDLTFAPLTPVANTNPAPVPGPLPLLGALLTWQSSRKLHKATRGGKQTDA